MEIFEIDGARPLHGSVKAQGSKNSVLPILAASLLSGGKCVIKNCPELSDVKVSLKILRQLGCKVEFCNNTAIVDSSLADGTKIPDGLMREMRSSVIFLGAVLARSGSAEMCLPGGCELGPRPIDLHIAALTALGADVDFSGGRILCRAEKLHGAEVNFTSVSVGATENAMIAAAMAEGDTVITNAAREPEIEDLQSFLNGMGADISGAGTNTIRICGRDKLHGTEHRVIPDRIVVATILSAVAACGGIVRVNECVPAHVMSITNVLQKMGCDIRSDCCSITLISSGKPESCRMLKTAVYPGFPTDAQPILLAASLTADGTSVFMENIFENRFGYVPELRRMGADITVSGKTAVVAGVKKLAAADVEAPDLRGGAALMIAAMNATGVSRIYGLKHIDRGYESPEKLFSELGAHIERKEAIGTERTKE